MLYQSSTATQCTAKPNTLVTVSYSIYSHWLTDRPAIIAAEQATCWSDISDIAAGVVVQKARLTRLRQSKLAARRAIAEGTRRFDEWQRRCRARSADTAAALSGCMDAVARSSMDVCSAGQPMDKKDLFELQHFHLLKCLERTTVTHVHNP